LGISSVITTLTLQGRLLQIDQFVMLGAAAMLLAFLFFGLRVSRLKGAILLASYLVYLGVMFGYQ
jgi:cation:H+ antiporter